MSRLLRTVATVTFYAEYPDDDPSADDRADLLTDELTDAINALVYVAPDSVIVNELDTVPE